MFDFFYLFIKIEYFLWICSKDRLFLGISFGYFLLLFYFVLFLWHSQEGIMSLLAKLCLSFGFIAIFISGSWKGIKGAMVRRVYIYLQELEL